MKKLFYLGLFLGMVTLMSCGGKQGPSEQEIQERIDAAVKAALQERTVLSEAVPYSESSNSEDIAKQENRGSFLVGKYKFNDDKGVGMLKVKDDGGVEVIYNNETYYGSWKVEDDCYEIKMADIFWLYIHGEKEPFWYPEIDLDAQWLYEGVAEFNAKSPKGRVKLEKVN